MHPNFRDVKRWNLKKKRHLKMGEKSFKNKGVSLCLFPFRLINKPSGLVIANPMLVVATKASEFSPRRGGGCD